ncbi:hypothetical protein ACLOJK_038465 [Asimina triloba]
MSVISMPDSSTIRPSPITADATAARTATSMATIHQYTIFRSGRASSSSATIDHKPASHEHSHDPTSITPITLGQNPSKGKVELGRERREQAASSVAEAAGKLRLI